MFIYLYIYAIYFVFGFGFFIISQWKLCCGKLCCCCCVSNQLYQYLNDDGTSFEMLAKYPLLQDLSIKMNTPLTSSAPVERLFSLAQIVNNPRRHALKDFSFEKLVVMKANAKTEYS